MKSFAMRYAAHDNRVPTHHHACSTIQLNDLKSTCRHVCCLCLAVCVFVCYFMHLCFLCMLCVAVRVHQMDAPPMSPFPSVRCHPPSPRRVSQRHSVYVSPHKASGGGLTPNSLTFRINSSPSKVSSSHIANQLLVHTQGYSPETW